MTDKEPVKQEPPGYPYPGEEIIYSSVRNAPNLDIGEDSWFAVSKMSEAQEHIFNGREHRNPYRFTIHSPVRGSTSMFIKRADASIIIQAMLSVMADHGKDGVNDEAKLFEDYYDDLISDDYEVEFIKDSDDNG
jgi:hypothetical protein